MTDDEKKRWLWRYRGSLEKEKALRADLQEQESRAAKTTATLTGRRYVLGQKWEVIAYEMHMDYTNVWRRHRCVLANLAIECKG